MVCEQQQVGFEVISENSDDPSLAITVDELEINHAIVSLRRSVQPPTDHLALIQSTVSAQHSRVGAVPPSWFQNPAPRPVLPSLHISQNAINSEDDSVSLDVAF